MPRDDVVVAVFSKTEDADAAIRQLTVAGFGGASMGVAGKGYQAGERVVSFYNVGNGVRFSGPRGSFWSGLWGLFVGGLLTTVPVVGPIVVVGYLAPAVLSAVEGPVPDGGLGMVGAGIHALGIPRDSASEYEAALGADGLLVMVRGDAAEIGRAGALLAAANPGRLDWHAGVRALIPAI